ncbi:MAG TPA: diaminopimelate epimerase [Gemmatimonadales bacterium]|nr:diaminopimelate epimerase [Gemmatimonadales bacterium]
MTQGLPIYKMSGSGNDFVFVDGRHSAIADWNKEQIAELCARGTGVGADGLVFVTPGSGPGAVRMVYYNSDGSHAAMCGNAALCSTRLAAHLGIAGKTMRLETDAGVYESRVNGAQDRAELHLAPVVEPKEVPKLGLMPDLGEKRAALGTVGVPHLVVLVEDVDHIDLMGRGKALRGDKALGSAGANVNFISAGSGGRWKMRTYERGVEAETLACGTGAVTAGCVLSSWGLATLPVVFLTRSGRELKVSAKLAGAQYDDVWLEGEARMVFRGVLT